MTKQNPKKSFEAIRPEDSLNSLDQEVQNPKPKASIGNLDNSEEFFSTFNGANQLTNLTVKRRRFKKADSAEDSLGGNKSAIVVTMSPLQIIR